MAAQTIPNYSRDIRHGKSSSGSSSNYGPVPGSPTLTNPDMILPDNDWDISLDEPSQSHIPIWNNIQPADMRFHLPNSQNQFIAGPISPATPIIYGNGTMLSDIGEVTEVESVVGKGGRRGSAQLSVYSNEDHVLGSSPTAGASRIKSRSQIQKRERKSSLDSNSTITSQGRARQFGDFDDAVSVDDVNFQGDDEESMASSYVEGTAAREPQTVRVPRIQDISIQRHSSSSLSDRAEQILANAKQRLTVGFNSNLMCVTDKFTDNGREPLEGKEFSLYSYVRWLDTFSSNCAPRHIVTRVHRRLRVRTKPFQRHQ